MATIYPFPALRPAPEHAPEVASVPYDVVNREEARQLADGRPRSFLHVTRPEIGLPSDVDPYGDDVYKKGAAALRAFMDEGTLIRDPEPRLYIYSLTWRGHTQTGTVLLASVAEYDRNEVKKHEFTRPDKEDDRVRHMEILEAQSGTVFLLHRDHDGIATIVDRVTSDEPVVDFSASDDVRHRFWVVEDRADIDGLVHGFATNGPLYIADGHHRSAAASRVAEARSISEAGFLAVSFPVSQVQILPYNRVVHDLNGQSEEDLLAALGEWFEITEGKPEAAKKTFGMYLGGKWHGLRARPGSWDDLDPVGRLDVAVLQSRVLGPLLGIEDPRRDKRIEFVGGIRGDGELEKRVAAHSGDSPAVAFSLCATDVEELLAIADAEQVMPPKSTWFEPKLRDGLFVHLL